MNICVDVGNTSIGFGIYQDHKIIKNFSLYPENIGESFDYVSYLTENINENNIRNIIYSSVVPSVDTKLIPALKEVFGLDVIRIKTLPINVKVRGIDINEVGDDLICDLVGAKEILGYPTLIVDLGTASKILLIDKENVFDTCLIIPGLSMSIASLSSKAALLPTIDLKIPQSVLAHNTYDAMNAGIVLGHAEMINGLCSRIEEEIGYKCKKIITGGSAKYLLHELKDEFIYEPNLSFIGMNKMFEDR